MDMVFNMGDSASQNILILQDEFGTIEAHTYSTKETFNAELDLTEEFNKKVLFKKEASKD
jgi:hypothetical protein